MQPHVTSLGFHLRLTRCALFLLPSRSRLAQDLSQLVAMDRTAVGWSGYLPLFRWGGCVCVCVCVYVYVHVCVGGVCVCAVCGCGCVCACV